jgi:DNA topoisomerase-3
VKQLLNNKKTDIIEGFLSKSGNKFNAALKLTDSGQVIFDFPDRPEPIDTNLACPRCKAYKLKKSQWFYECDCGFKIGHTIAQFSLTEDIMQELFTDGKTKDKLTGFISKTGNPFDAYLKYADEKIQFDFDNFNSSSENTVSISQSWLDEEPVSDEYWASLMAGAAEESK